MSEPMEDYPLHPGREPSVEKLISIIRSAANPPEADDNPAELQGLDIGDLVRECDYGGSIAGAIDQIPVKASGAIGALERVVKRFLKWTVHWNTRAQADFNRVVIDSLRLAAGRLRTQEHNSIILAKMIADERRRQAETSRRFDDRLDALAESLQDLGRRLDSATLAVYWSDVEKRLESEIGALRQETASERRQANEKLKGFASALAEIASQNGSAEIERINSEVDDLRMRLLGADHGSRLQPDEDLAASSLGSRADSEGSLQASLFDYFAFEEKFRGTRSEIKRRQAQYLEFFLDRQNVVDLGCGRGEFVELLTERGVNVTGVDASSDMVDYCRDRGLPVVKSDIFRYLDQLSGRPLDGVFVSQVVEHFPPEDILKLTRLCRDKLKPDGVIILETVNTDFPEALSNFYLDPSHVRPVPAKMLSFMLEQADFEIEWLRFISPVPGSTDREVLKLKDEYPRETSLYMEYAIIARRR